MRSTGLFTRSVQLASKYRRQGIDIVKNQIAGSDYNNNNTETFNQNMK